jgi:hypothetical protein
MSDLTYKQLNSIQWTKDGVDDSIQYLKTMILPKSLHSYTAKSRFRKRLEHFIVEDGNLYFYLNETPSWAKDETGKQLYDVHLPIKLQVIYDDKQKEKIVSDMYLNSQTGYRGFKTMYEKITEKYLGITREDVIRIMKNIELKQLDVTFVNRIVRPIIASYPNYHWEIDLIDMQNLQSNNSHFYYLFCCVDIFSKFAWVKPIKNKSSEVISMVLKDIILTEGPPKVISSDNGLEFVNSDVDALCKEFGIEQRHSLPYKPTTQGQIERFNGSLKAMIKRHINKIDRNTFIPHLQNIVYSYNSSVHSTIGFTPFQVHRHAKDALISLVKDKIEVNAQKMIEKDLKKHSKHKDDLSVGDYVRVSKYAIRDQRGEAIKLKGKFKKGSVWSSDIYTIKEIIQSEKEGDKATYLLKDLDVARPFFRYELQLIDQKNIIKYDDEKDKKEEDNYDEEQYVETTGGEDVEAFEQTQKEFEKEEKQEEEKEEKEEELKERRRRGFVNYRLERVNV